MICIIYLIIGALYVTWSVKVNPALLYCNKSWYEFTVTVAVGFIVVLTWPFWIFTRAYLLMVERMK
jgi:hypothetical protein